MTNPYSGLPDHCFWSRSHRGRARPEIDPVVKGGFTLTPEMKIATAGSCFAQHIAKHLQGAGYNYFVTEDAHPVISPVVARQFGYGVFSARYGNIYTVRQLLQLAGRAFGEFTPVEDVWEVDGGFVDPFRPNVTEKPFPTMEAFTAAREAHYAAVREMLTEADVFVFTLGLTEAWVSREDGTVFAMAPGVAGGTFDPERHEFHNFTVDEIVQDFTDFATGLRTANPDVKILLTVSPVPLIATAREDQSVITATAYSKAVLRVAAEQLSATVPDCFYFPSYEVITGNHAGGDYFASDLRDVEPAGVAHVMSLFMRHYTEAGAEAAPEVKDGDPRFEDEVQDMLDVICDELMIEKSVSS
ncbi:GSCFA domain-containing protein [Pseudaestuariivita atlantica]|uniref:GSCFA domain-containing protein n=1 Tax=Pseudaestuariivita atlantica TaxID=1317121 RepID=A0A0L1JKG1_9RHOB|nr:GSCFA domain-containing protein [Pseudaestuariivita atlantica]KNG92235.1 GSCFA domain-containing protein [Pseudaestuariivita atlantica]